MYFLYNTCRMRGTYRQTPESCLVIIMKQTIFIVLHDVYMAGALIKHEIFEINSKNSTQDVDFSVPQWLGLIVYSDTP